MLGLSGYAETASHHAMIDPEALLLVSTRVARHDPRLFDEILDWLQDQGDWINLQRLSRMQEEYALGDSRVLAAIATRLVKASAHQKWRVLVLPVLDTAVSPRPLFPDAGHFGSADTDFLAHGWQRGPARYRGLAVTPRLDHAGSLLLKLRALFGRQSRAEVMAWLLTHPAGHPAQIAREAGYFARSVQLTLNELERSGHVFARREKREKHFSLKQDEWRFLCTWKTPADAFPRWLPWPVVFKLLGDALELLGDSALESSSAELRAIEWRRRLDYGALAGHGLPVDWTLSIDARGEAAMAFHQQRLMDLLNLSA